MAAAVAKMCDSGTWKPKRWKLNCTNPKWKQYQGWTIKELKQKLVEKDIQNWSLVKGIEI